MPATPPRWPCAAQRSPHGGALLEDVRALEWSKMVARGQAPAGATADAGLEE